MGFASAQPILRTAGLALLAALVGHPAPATAQSSATDKIYADLAALPPEARSKRIEDGARSEGKLVIIHTMRGNLSTDHVELFRKRYPFLKIELEGDIGSQDAAERLYTEETAGRHLTDVVNVALPDLSALRAKDMLARFVSPATASILPRYQGFIDAQGHWTAWYWSEHGISYNSSLVPKDKAPRSWDDLCNPFFKGNVSYDPAEDRYLAGLYAMLGEQGTERLLKCIGENDPIIQRGHAQRMELMLAGDHMVQGDNYLYQGVAMQRKNPATPFAIVYSAAIIATNDVAAINRNAPNPYAAALFADWTLSAESQAYLAAWLRGPVALPHPYLPDNVELVDNVDPPKDVMDRLLADWFRSVEKRR